MNPQNPLIQFYFCSLFVLLINKDMKMQLWLPVVQLWWPWGLWQGGVAILQAQAIKTAVRGASWVYHRITGSFCSGKRCVESTAHRGHIFTRQPSEMQVSVFMALDQLLPVSASAVCQRTCTHPQKTQSALHSKIHHRLISGLVLQGATLFSWGNPSKLSTEKAVFCFQFPL